MAGAALLEKPYAEFIEDRFAEAQLSQAAVVFTNRGADRARAVIRLMIKHTEASLLIFSGSLSSDIYNSDELRSCAGRLSSPVKILLSDPISSARPSAVTALGEEIKSSKIEVRLLRPEVNRARLNHFVISDGRHLRAEDSHEDLSAVVILRADLAENVPAHAQENMAARYEVLFNRLWGDSNPVGADGALLLAHA
jgi:hypothetical protein